MDALRKINKIIIKDSEIAILKKYNIIVNEYSSFDEILFQIDNIIDDLSDEEYDELDFVASNLMERKYYEESPK